MDNHPPKCSTFLGGKLPVDQRQYYAVGPCHSAMRESVRWPAGARQQDAGGSAVSALCARTKEACRIINLRDELVAEQRLVFNGCDARGEVGILLEALPVRERPHVAKARDLHGRLHAGVETMGSGRILERREEHRARWPAERVP